MGILCVQRRRCSSVSSPETSSLWMLDTFIPALGLIRLNVAVSIWCIFSRGGGGEGEGDRTITRESTFTWENGYVIFLTIPAWFL